MSRTFVQPGDVLDWVNGTGNDVSAGDVVVLGDSVGIANVDIANGETGAVTITGVHSVPKAAGTAWSQGDKLDWDASAEAFKKGVTPATGDVTDCAIAAADADSGATTGLIKIENPGAIN